MLIKMKMRPNKRIKLSFTTFMSKFCKNNFGYLETKDFYKTLEPNIIIKTF